MLRKIEEIEMFEYNQRLRISDLYNIIMKGIEDFKIQWVNDGLIENSEKYFMALDSAFSDSEVDSGLSDYRKILNEKFEKECQERLKKMRGF